MTRDLQSRLLLWMGLIRTMGSWQQEFEWAYAWARKKIGKGVVVSYAFAMGVYIILQERNDMRFQARTYN